MIAPTQRTEELWGATGLTQICKEQVKASPPDPEDASLRSCWQPHSEDRSGRGSGRDCRCVTDQQEGFMLPKCGDACCRSQMHFVVKTGLDL